MLIHHRIHKRILHFRMSPVSGKYLFLDTNKKDYGGGKEIFN